MQRHIPPFPSLLICTVLALSLGCDGDSPEQLSNEDVAQAQTTGRDSSQPLPDTKTGGVRSCGSDVAPCISCTKTDDCFVSAFSIDQKKSWMQACGAQDLCVECLGDDDDFSCGVNTFSLGPKCIDNLCGCDDSVTCTGNINGWRCLNAQGKSYCGCETDDDCGMTGFPCVDNPYAGGKTCKNVVWPD